MDHPQALFDRAILQSSPASTILTSSQASKVADDLIGALPAGSTPSNASMAELLYICASQSFIEECRGSTSSLRRWHGTSGMGAVFVDLRLESYGCAKKGWEVTLYELDLDCMTFAQSLEGCALHCVELPLLFGQQDAWKRAPMLGDEAWRNVQRRGKKSQLERGLDRFC
ncbi:hypothetical protein CBOM_01708 [Ceraceosorus bombacis]|uniref:Uncharacterized protein n=1 Tax=Ceraceosorus bombacis TaxID=401625 RepID=A0A0P1BCS1_9BASI|nr:hypothetical protein CBOM_01708 [Ceraceosorus bombacis]